MKMMDAEFQFAMFKLIPKSVEYTSKELLDK